MDIIWKHFCSSLFLLHSCPHSLNGKRFTGLPFPTCLLNSLVPVLPSLYLHHPSLACSVPWFLPSVPCISTIFKHIAYSFTQVHPECRHTSNKLHGITCLKTVIFNNIKHFTSSVFLFTNKLPSRLHMPLCLEH